MEDYFLSNLMVEREDKISLGNIRYHLSNAIY